MAASSGGRFTTPRVAETRERGEGRASSEKREGSQEERVEAFLTVCSSHTFASRKVCRSAEVRRTACAATRRKNSWSPA